MASIKPIIDSDGKQRHKDSLLVYRAWFCNGTKPDGKPNIKSKTVYAKSDRDAERQAMALEADFKRGLGEINSTDKTFIQLVNKYREEFYIDQKEKTLARYDDLLNNQLIPYFANMKLKDMKPEIIQAFVKYLGRDGVRADHKPGGYSEKTIKDNIVLLRAMMEVAVDWEWIARNPCRRVKIPKIPKREANVYTKDNIEQVLEAFKREEDELEYRFNNSRKYKEMADDKREERMMLLRLQNMMYKVYVMIAFNTGARRSEMLGLRYSDINKKNNTIRFSRTSQHVTGKGIKDYDVLKNGSTSKTISVSPLVIELIYNYQTEQVRTLKYFKWNKTDRLFISLKGGELNRAGGPLNPDSVSQWWARFLARNNLPKITLHQVRHTNISVSLDEGVPLTVVAQRAGHACEDITLNRYGHALEASETRAGKIFDDIFSDYVEVTKEDKQDG